MTPPATLCPPMYADGGWTPQGPDLPPLIRDVPLRFKNDILIHNLIEHRPKHGNSLSLYRMRKREEKRNELAQSTGSKNYSLPDHGDGKPAHATRALRFGDVTYRGNVLNFPSRTG